MAQIEVQTQRELDNALKKQKPGDTIVCLGGTWDNPLIVRGSSRVEAWGSSSVEARGSSRVVAWGSSRVVARESSSVEARGSSRVVARESSRVEARESSSVEASKYVPVQRFGTTPQVKGGVLIDIPDVSEMTAREWCDYYGVKVERGYAILFKAVDDDLSTSRARRVGLTYTVGTKVVAPDWAPHKDCGNGLHASPSPHMALGYNSGATRFVKVKAKLADLVVIDDKIKAPALSVVVEVGRWGDEITALEAAAA